MVCPNVETDSGNVHYVTKWRRLKKHDKKRKGKAGVQPNFDEMLKQYFLWLCMSHCWVQNKKTVTALPELWKASLIDNTNFDLSTSKTLYYQYFVFWYLSCQIFPQFIILLIHNSWMSKYLICKMYKDVPNIFVHKWTNWNLYC